MVDYREIDEGYFWYLAPLANCRECKAEMWLPYEDLVQTNADQLFSLEYEGLLELPSEEWSLVLACPECGLVDTYGGADVDEEVVPKKVEARYHSNATFFCAAVPCGNRHCGSQATVYGYITDGTEADFLNRLRRTTVHGLLPCGHQLRPDATRYCEIHRVTERLW